MISDLGQVVRLFERIESEETRSAFFRLYSELCACPMLFMMPLDRGKFSAIHVATSPDARPYGDAEFAFKGAKTHMRWWFRKPAFDTGLIQLPLLEKEIDGLKLRKDGEAITDIATVLDADRVLAIVNHAVGKRHRVNC